MTEYLKRPKSLHSADQCREMGVEVGDTILGREGFGGWWGEARLRLIWIGERVTVFSYENRTSTAPEWTTPVESANWSLNCRQWRKV